MNSIYFKIISIEDIPLFLKKSDTYYLNLVYEFINILLNLSVDNIDENYIMIYNKNINNKFIDYYLDQVKIDKYTYAVKYEDELDIPKSVLNEIFKIKLDNGKIYDVIIKSYINNYLKLEIIK
jgi:hypothetical protein